MTEMKIMDPEPVIREIKRQIRRKFTSDEKIRIVIEGNWHNWFNNKHLTLPRDNQFTQAKDGPGNWPFR
jgi:hypothetical protein